MGRAATAATLRQVHASAGVRYLMGSAMEGSDEDMMRVVRARGALSEAAACIRSAPPVWIAIAATLTGCFSDPVDSPLPSDIRARLEVTGGIAAVQYSLVVDGADGIVRGESCVRVCDYQPGDVLLPLSDFQLGDLARSFEAAGIFALDGTDFGTACCDEFHFVLEYDDGARSSIVRGTASRFPDRLRDVISRVHAFHTGRLPAIVDFASRPQDWPADPIGIDSIRINGPVLDLFVGYSGGCRYHSVDFVAWNGFLESEPVQVGVHIAHDARRDLCEAFIHARRTFDLSPLRLAWEEAYGPGPGTIRIRLPRPGFPDLLVLYSF